MSSIQPTINQTIGRALYMPAPVKPAEPQATPKPPVTPSEPDQPSPNLRLGELVSRRAKASGDSLKALLNKADSVLEQQNRMLDDVNRLLGMEKSSHAYHSGIEM